MHWKTTVFHATVSVLYLYNQKYLNGQTSLAELSVTWVSEHFIQHALILYRSTFVHSKLSVHIWAILCPQQLNSFDWRCVKGWIQREVEDVALLTVMSWF